MNWYAQILRRVIPHRASEDARSIFQTAHIAVTLRTSTDPEAARLLANLHAAEDDYLVAIEEQAKGNIVDLLIQEATTGHVDLAPDARHAVLEARSAAEAWLAAHPSQG